MLMRTIHHFEDEPEYVRWIPSALLNRYWAMRPDWIAGEGDYVEHENEDGNTVLTTFKIVPNGAEITIAHRIYRDVVEFQTCFANFVADGDVALIDLMSARDDARNEPDGLEVYKSAQERLGAGRAYLLTAYPNEMMNFDRKYLLEKPPDAKLLIDLLVDKLAIG